MNAKHIESKFAAMGARLKVREIAPRWPQGDRTWIDPTDSAVDIRRDGNGLAARCVTAIMPPSRCRS